MAKVVVFLIIRLLVEGDPREAKVLRSVETVGETPGFGVVDEGGGVVGSNHPNLTCNSET